MTLKYKQTLLGVEPPNGLVVVSSRKALAAQDDLAGTVKLVRSLHSNDHANVASATAGVKRFSTRTLSGNVGKPAVVNFALMAVNTDGVIVHQIARCYLLNRT